MIRGGKSYVSACPAFSNDAKRLLVCSGNTVAIFSTSTGLQVASLDGHAAEVTSVIVVPASTPETRMLCYCWTASIDGTIRYWDFSAPELMKTIDVRLPIFSMVIPSLLSNPSESNEKDLFAYISTANVSPKRPNLSGQIQKCNLTKSKVVGGVILKETKRPELITICSSGRYFGILSKHKIFIWKVPETESDRVALKKITLHHTKDITVMAFHHTQRIVAVGDATGRILIWRQFGGRTFSTGNEGDMMDLEEERPGVRGNDDAESCSTWHWHPSEVNVLTFSTDGAYLYSGGKEGVLVVWQLDTGKKKFLPRIGSPLLYFVDSPDPSLASISCADNQIHLLKMPSLEISKSISGIKLPCSYPESLRSICGGYAFDRKAGIVAVPTEDYGIQFYSLLDDHGISEVTVCERNHQPGDEVTVVVTLMALSSDSSVLSTVEVRLPENGLGGLVSLKFWIEGSQSKQFSLSTVIYEPHRDSHISAIAFRPNQLMAVTTSTGGDFKIWVCSGDIQQKQQSYKNLGWMCHAVGAYKKKPMTAAAFSADGSVLAVAAETIITLWDPDRNVLVAVIGETSTPIKTLTFLGQSEYVLSACGGSKPQLSVWSLSKLARFWSCTLHVEAVAYAEDSSTFAVLALLPESIMQIQEVGRDGIILVFDVKDPAPVKTWSVRQAEGGGLAFIQPKPSEDGKSDHFLAFINGHHEYVLFDPFSEEVEERSVSASKAPDSEETEKTGYASLYGELPEFNSKKNWTDSEVAAVVSERPWETIFSGSSHNLPPLTKLCAAFLESLLEKRPAAATTTVE